MGEERVGGFVGPFILLLHYNESSSKTYESEYYSFAVVSFVLSNF